MRKFLLLLIFTLFSATASRAQIYYLMPGDFTCASPNPANCKIDFLTVASQFAGVSVNGRSRWPYIMQWSAADAYQGGTFDDSTNYDYGVMFTVMPEFVADTDTTTYPTVKVTHRVVYFSLDQDAGALSNQYICFKYRYRWVNDGAAGGFDNNNFKVPTNWRADACKAITGLHKREMIKWFNDEVIPIKDEASNSLCQPGGARCPRGMLISQLYRIRANDVCLGSGNPLPCCDGPGSGMCCDGPANSDTTCPAIPGVFRLWAIKLVVDGGL